jgi:hypothetical protein
MVSRTFTRAQRLELPSTRVHGASTVLVRSIISCTASSYCGHFSRLRQSSSVIFHCFQGRVLPLLEPGQLLLRRDVDPEFEEHGAVTHQFGFERVDLGECATPLVVAREPFDPLDQHPAVPAAIEDGQAAVAGQAAPESPQIVVRTFLVGGCGDGDDGVVAGVQGAGGATDGPTLAGRVPALEGRDDGELLLARLQEQPAEPGLAPPRAGSGTPSSSGPGSCRERRAR